MEKTTELFQTAPRDIVVTNRDFTYANVEAWKNIIESYLQNHPEHDVAILYEGKTLANLITLFKMEAQPNRHGFQMVVTAPDKNLKDVPKLYRFLVEGAGPNFARFIEKEMYQVLKLF